MHIDGTLSRVELSYLILELANSTNGALKSLFDENSFLRLHTLIVALFKFSVDVNVLDVKYRQVLENFIFGPIHEDGLASLVQLVWFVLILYLFLQLVHCFLQLQVICTIEYNTVSISN